MDSYLIQPDVSVIMTVYNGEQYLRESIDSILNQTFTHFELIIIDDKSTDNTKKILESYDDKRLVRLYNQRNLKAAIARNIAIAAAQGKYIAIQDADDISLPDRLACEVDILNRCEDITLVGTAFHAISPNGEILGTYSLPLTDTAIRWQMLFQNSFIHTSVMFRAEPIRRYGLRYETHLVPSEDYALWSQLLQYGRVMNLELPLVKYRYHEQQLSNVYKERQWKTADEVSRKNLEGSGISVNDTELRILRDWHLKFPRLLTKQEMVYYAKMLTIFRLFEEQPDMDGNTTHCLRRRWIKHTLSGVKLTQWHEAWSSGLFRALICEGSSIFLQELFTQLGIRALHRFIPNPAVDLS